jgi:hypothetical protein
LVVTFIYEALDFFFLPLFMMLGAITSKWFTLIYFPATVSKWWVITY